MKLITPFSSLPDLFEAYSSAVEPARAPRRTRSAPSIPVMHRNETRSFLTRLKGQASAMFKPEKKDELKRPELRTLAQHHLAAVRRTEQIQADVLASMEDNLPQTKREFKQFEKDLIGHLTHYFQTQGNSAKNAKKAARSEYKRAFVAHLNARPWTPIRKTLYHGDKFFTSELTPAGHMKLGSDRCLFAKDYEGKGISSGSIKECNHAVNLWISEFHETSLERDTPLCRFVRHGILSPYGVADKDARTEGALNRAKEVVTAGLFLDPATLKTAIAEKKEIKLKLSSTSLVTAVNIFNQTEGSQLADQLEAWATLSEKPFALTVFDENGHPQTVTVDLEVAAFNFGVNEAALNRAVGWHHSDPVNKKGLKQLIGENLKPLENGDTPGGWVGEYLEGNRTADNTGLVRKLDAQIRDIWKNKSHRRDGGEPYKLAQRITLLANEIGVIPCYNCKSGKDRTGMLDVELKREAIHMHTKGEPSTVGPLDPEQQRVFGKVLEHGGNLEIQERNTGVGGNKVLKDNSFLFGNLSLKKRIARSSLIVKAKGASAFVKS